MRQHVVWEEPSKSNQSSTKFSHYQSVLQKIKESDILVAEVSLPAEKLGFEIGVALEHKKHVICLFRGNQEPRLLESLEPKLTERRLFVINYNATDLESQLELVLSDIRKLISQRFTILLPTHILNHLDNVSARLGMPRSVYIRQLIEREMNDE